MKTLIVTLVLILSQLTCGAQQSESVTTPQRNTIYIEAFGQGIYNSLSFDRLYRVDKKVKSSLTMGLTLIPLMNTADHIFVIGVPVSYNWLFGETNHHFELGAGLTALRITEQVHYEDHSTENISNSYLYFSPKFSYRYQRQEGGLFFRLSFTPAVALVEKSGYGDDYYIIPDAWTPFAYRVFPWPGVSLGWTLKCAN